GWCSIAPRSEFGALERSRVLKRIDDEPVWSIVCFYISKPHRHQGLLRALIGAAVTYAASQGARIVEAYPTNLQDGYLSPEMSYMGIPGIFIEHGFHRVAEPSGSRQIMRHVLG
ncbi:MAG: N-acetyltransferase, partial [Anaerolineales bacterium]